MSRKRASAKKRVDAALLIGALLSVMVAPLHVFFGSLWGVVGTSGLILACFLVPFLAERRFMFFSGALLSVLCMVLVLFFVTPWWYSLHGERVDGCVLVDSEYQSGGRRSSGYYEYRFQCGDRVLESTSRDVEFVGDGDTMALSVDSTGLLPTVAPVPNEENAPYGPYALGGYFLLAVGLVGVSAWLSRSEKPTTASRVPSVPVKGDFL